MKKEIRGRAKRFLTSEAGRVGIRTPLALGIASGAFLLSQMVYTPSAEASCSSDADCGPGRTCEELCVDRVDGTCNVRIITCV